MNYIISSTYSSKDQGILFRRESHRKKITRVEDYEHTFHSALRCKCIVEQGKFRPFSPRTTTRSLHTLTRTVPEVLQGSEIQQSASVDHWQGKGSLFTQHQGPSSIDQWSWVYNVGKDIQSSAEYDRQQILSRFKMVQEEDGEILRGRQIEAPGIL